MSRILITFVASAALALGLVGVAGAAPKEDNRNVEVIPVNCDGIGSIDVITMEHSATAFGPDGEVFVAKGFAGEFAGTVTTHDGTTFAFSESFEDGPKGKGFEDRLIDCTFTESESETFILDAEGAGFFGIPEAYVGTEVTLEGTFNGTASVLTPGR